MLDPARCEVAKELYWGKGRRPKAEDALALEVVTRIARQADILLDIGAYTGLFTVACASANPRLRIHAFEIVPDVVELLKKNLARNDMTDRVTVHLEGVGREGNSMRVPSGIGGSALPSFYSSRMLFEEGDLVSFNSLDSFTDSIPTHARVVMKIDVEGTESFIFCEGRRFLEAFKPDILCEVLHGVGRGDVVEHVLEPLHYRYYLVTDRGLVAKSRVVPDVRFRDWLFTPRDQEPADVLHNV